MNIKDFWEDYFIEDNGYKIAEIGALRKMVWFTKNKIIVGYNYPFRRTRKRETTGIRGHLEGTIQWEIHFKDIKVNRITFMNATTLDPRDNPKVGELLEVIEKLQEPRLLPLLIGIEWIAPIVSELLKEHV